MSAPLISRSLFNPQPMEKWDIENATQAKNYCNKLLACGRVFFNIGLYGAGFAGVRAIAIGFTAALATPTIVIIGITAIALVCLGLCLSHLAKKHIQGMDVNAFAVQKLLEGFDKLTIYRTDEERLHALSTDKNYIHNLAYKALEESAVFTSIAEALYNPMSETQPRFRIKNGKWTHEQIQALLDKAYERGIILEFSQLFTPVPPFGKEPSPQIEAHKEYNKSDVAWMQYGFNTAWMFLEKRLQDKTTFDVNKVNAQLDALGYKWKSISGDKVAKPNFYMEDKNTVVIRGNCSEIPSPTDAIKHLAPLVERIKMPLAGLQFVECNETVDGKEKKLTLGKDWETYLSCVKEIALGRLKIEDNQAAQQQETIWQNSRDHELSMWTRLKFAWQDGNRIDALQQQAQPATVT